MFTSELLDMPAVSRVLQQAEELPLTSKSLRAEDLGLLRRIIGKLNKETLSRYLEWVETGRLPNRTTLYEKTRDDDLREQFFQALVSRGMSWGLVQKQLDELEGGGNKRRRKTKRRRRL